MTALTTQRYTYEPNPDGTYSILDTVTGECVGTTPDEKNAKMSVQRLTALRGANERRTVLADFKRHLYSLPRTEGAALLAARLREDSEDPTFGALPIQAALLSVKGIGHSKASIIVRSASVTALSRRVRELTPRQRGAIAAALEVFR